MARFLVLLHASIDHHAPRDDPSRLVRPAPAQAQPQRPSAARWWAELAERGPTSKFVLEQVIPDFPIPPSPHRRQLPFARIAQRVPNRQSQHHPFDLGEIKVRRQRWRSLIENRPACEIDRTLAEETI